MRWLKSAMVVVALALPAGPIMLLPTPVLADQAADRAALNALFEQLRTAPDEATARAIDQRIWALWTRPSDPELADAMSLILTARSSYEFDVALDLIDTLVARHPTYAEAWNQRATIHYMQQDYQASLADIDKVLALEPRHFGALSGRALVHMALGDRQAALMDMARALRIHPFLPERALFPELKREMTRI